MIASYRFGLTLAAFAYVAALLTACGNEADSPEQSAANINVPTEKELSTPVPARETDPPPQTVSMAPPKAQPPTEPAETDADGADSTPSQPTNEATPASAPKSDRVASFIGLAAPKPTTWLEQMSSSTSRVATYTVPGVDGNNAAELIIFYFEPGGTVEANIQRWVGQFRGPDDAPVEPEIDTFTAGDFDVTLAELSGAYRGMVMDRHVPDYILLSAVFDYAKGKVFIQLVGPAATVQANREAYMAFLHGIRPVEATK